jgi:hypothetical protein
LHGTKQNEYAKQNDFQDPPQTNSQPIFKAAGNWYLKKTPEVILMYSQGQELLG